MLTHICLFIPNTIHIVCAFFRYVFHAIWLPISLCFFSPPLVRGFDLEDLNFWFALLRESRASPSNPQFLRELQTQRKWLLSVIFPFQIGVLDCVVEPPSQCAGVCESHGVPLLGLILILGYWESPSSGPLSGLPGSQGRPSRKQLTSLTQFF